MDAAQIDHQHPEVKEDLKQWGPWVLDVRYLRRYQTLTDTVKTTGAAAFRLDAIKHMDYQFLLEWVRLNPDRFRTSVAGLTSECFPPDSTCEKAAEPRANIRGRRILVRRVRPS